MAKIAFLFPGQGVQIRGMGKDFYENYEVARETYMLSGEATGLAVEQLCFEENDLLNITEYTQVALLTTEVAILKVIEQMGIVPDVCAGLSLGEYGALAAAKVFDMRDLFRLIRERGRLMQNEYPEGGAMSAVLGLDVDTISRICDKTEGIVSIANDNCPGQIVITGEQKAVDEASLMLTEAGAKRCIPLTVSGPFHSPLLAGAGKKLGQVMEDMRINTPTVPYISNVKAEVVDSADEIKELLEKQVSASVRFRESLIRLLEMGVDTFVEIGPGKTLAGFLKKIDKEARVINIQTVSDLEKLKDI